MSSKQKDIARLIKLMGVDIQSAIKGRMDALWEEVFSKSIPKEKIGMAEAERIKFMQREDPAARLMKAHVKAYDSRLSHEEIKELLVFHETPVARKFIEALADITREVVRSSTDIIHNLGRDLTNHLQTVGVIPADTKAEDAKNRIMSSVLKRMSN